MNSKRASKKHAEKNKSLAAAKGVRKQHSKDENAPDVGKLHGIIDNNVQRKILSVITATRLDTTVHSATARTCLR